MSWPVGAAGRGSKLPNLSLRVGQARLGGNSGNPNAGDPMQHRELFRVEMFGREDAPALGLRLELGGRVTYDIHRGAFGLRADGWRRPSAVQLPTTAGNLLDFDQKRSLSSVVEMSGRHERITRLPPGLHPAIKGNRALEADLAQCRGGQCRHASEFTYHGNP